MSEETKSKEPSRVITLRQLITILLRRGLVIVLVSVLCAVLGFGWTYYMVEPTYQSSAVFYVNNGSFSVGDVSIGLSSGDLVAGRNLVASYIVILNSRSTLNDVIDYADLDLTYRQVKGMISAEAVDATEIFEVVVTSTDPYEAEKIANAVAEILPKRISKVIVGATASVVDYAVAATAPSGPSYTTNTLIAFLVGFVLSVCVVILIELLDVSIRNEEDVAQTCTHPVLAAVPDMMAQSKGGYYYRGSGKKANTAAKEKILIGENISFAASEAYKLLRTKLQFSFVDDHDSHVIGVSSALAGEGKSLTAINLAHSLAQLEKRVLLIDCDMRRPSLCTKLPIEKVPGLSNYLTRQVQQNEVIQHYTSSECAFDVISSGRNPPNPIELLSSSRMQKALDELRQTYDYIILDLPPVGEVSDALVAAKLADGILMVVRQDYCNRAALASAVNQFGFVDARILGVVLNCTGDSGARYSKRYRYKSYYRRYEGSYSAAAKSARRSAEAESEQ